LEQAARAASAIKMKIIRMNQKFPVRVWRLAIAIR
jgi:hypothetical protein